MTAQYLYRSRVEYTRDGKPAARFIDVVAATPKEAREQIERIQPGGTVRNLRRDGFVAATIPTR